MEIASVNGVRLEYVVEGSGEPVLLIGTGPIADSFLPFAAEATSVGRYRWIRYHQRGQVGSTPSGTPVSFGEHAADAAALLGHLGVRHAHVAGHSSGGAIALQLALDAPELVHTLALLEPPLLVAPSAGAFLAQAAPALAAYSAGDLEGAMTRFLSMVSSLDWSSCRTVIDAQVPGGVAQAMKDADALFASYLPALQAWEFGPRHAASICRPVLSAVGRDSERLFVEGHELIGSWFPRVEGCSVDGIGHLLHVQRPDPLVAQVAAFFARHPIAES
jgi:pimeloyl-ACP methyl ester carboxylesterase